MPARSPPARRRAVKRPSWPAVKRARLASISATTQARSTSAPSSRKRRTWSSRKKARRMSSSAGAKGDNFRRVVSIMRRPLTLALSPHGGEREKSEGGAGGAGFEEVGAGEVQVDGAGLVGLDAGAGV